MKRLFAASCVLTATFVLSAPALAGVVVYEEGDKKIEIGGRVQVQYARIDTDGESAVDDLFFRRLRPYIAGTVTKNWYAKIQIDFGESFEDDESEVKDAYIQYLGFGDRDMTLTVGNSKPPHSREFMTSSKRLQFIERTFAGGHNFGSPDRVLGAKLDGKTESEHISYGVMVGQEDHDPNVLFLDLDSPANTQEDWNEGNIVTGRVDWHPMGYVKVDRGDFHTDELKVAVGIGAFYWANDDDNNTYTDPLTGTSTSTEKADLDMIEGIEISASLRGHGWSGDAAYQMLSAETVDPVFTGGVFIDGDTDVDILSLGGGYMFPKNVEVAAGWASFDPDGYEDTWEQTIVGVNWFWNKYKAKLQVNYRMNENFLGAKGVDSDTFAAQMQFVF